MKKITIYEEIMWGEMSPDLYHGEHCDKIKPQWYIYAKDDKDGDYEDKVWDLKPENFPPGTKVTISIPCCPYCMEEQELCDLNEECKFNWNDWRDDTYQ